MHDYSSWKVRDKYAHECAAATASAQHRGIGVIKSVRSGCGGEAVVTLRTPLLSHVEMLSRCASRAQGQRADGQDTAPGSAELWALLFPWGLSALAVPVHPLGHLNLGRNILRAQVGAPAYVITEGKHQLNVQSAIYGTARALCLNSESPIILLHLFIGSEIPNPAQIVCCPSKKISTAGASQRED